MRLAICGASARAAAQSALAAGFEVTAADLFADADLASRCPVTKIDDWPHGFGPWLSATGCDGWLMTGGLENYPDLIQEWSKQQPFLGVDPADLRIVRNPEHLAGILSNFDLPFPTTYPALPNEPLAGEWLVKRLRSAGGWGVRPWQPGTPIAHGEEVLQQRIEGTPISAVYIATVGTNTCWGITRQLIAPPWTSASGFQYAGSIGPLTLPPASRTLVERTGAAVALAAGMVGVWGIDFMLAPDGTPWVLEVNPRYTASVEVIERATGQSPIGLHVAACRLEPLPKPSSSKTADIWGKAYLFAPRDISPGSDFTSHLHQLAATGHAADIPYPNVPIPQGMPVTTLLARGATPEEVESALETGLRDLTARLLASEGVRD